jgi:excisionase family DNA binding protein
MGGAIMLNDRLTYKPYEAASLLGIGRNTVYMLINSGVLRSIRIGRKLIVPASAIAEFLDSKTVEK